ncbi:MAG: hypothetical protein U0P81_02965 [Holophagaceae bacterium]
MPGYATRSTARKLGLAPGMRVCVVDGPAPYETLAGPLPPDLHVTEGLGAGAAFVHGFFTARTRLAACLAQVRRELAPDGVLWISWPKKAYRVPTDLTEDAIRVEALPLGFVDVKVCAVTEVWSGLKLMIRRELR